MWRKNGGETSDKVKNFEGIKGMCLPAERLETWGTLIKFHIPLMSSQDIHISSRTKTACILFLFFFVCLLPFSCFKQFLSRINAIFLSCVVTTARQPQILAMFNLFSLIHIIFLWPCMMNYSFFFSVIIKNDKPKQEVVPALWNELDSIFPKGELNIVLSLKEIKCLKIMR